MKVLKGHERKKELINSLMIIDEHLTMEELSELDINSLEDLHSFNLKENNEQEIEIKEQLLNNNTSKFDFISQEDFLLLQKSKEENSENEIEEENPNIKRAQRIERLYKSIQRIEKLDSKKFNHSIKDLNKLTYEEIEKLEEYLILKKTESESNNKLKIEEEQDNQEKEELITQILKSEDISINKSGDETKRKYKKEDLDKKNIEELKSITKIIKDDEFITDRKLNRKKMRMNKDKLIQSIVSNYSKLEEMGVKINLKNSEENIFTKRRLETMTFDKLERIDKRVKDKLSLEEQKKKEVKNKNTRQEKLLLIRKLKRRIYLKGGKVDKEILKDLEKKDNQELDVIISKLQKIESELPKTNLTEERSKKLIKKGVNDLKSIGKNITNELKQGIHTITNDIEQFDNSMN